MYSIKCKRKMTNFSHMKRIAHLASQFPFLVFLLFSPFVISRRLFCYLANKTSVSASQTLPLSERKIQLLYTRPFHKVFITRKTVNQLYCLITENQGISYYEANGDNCLLSHFSVIPVSCLYLVLTNTIKYLRS